MKSSAMMKENEYIIRKIIVCAAVPNPQTHVCRAGEKQFDRFFYVVKGSISINFAGGSSVTASSGELLYLPADIEYVSSWDEKVESYYISLNFILEDLQGRICNLFDKPILFYEDHERELYKLFHEAKKVYLKHGGFVSIILKGYYYQILYCVAKKIEYDSIKQSCGKNEVYKAIVYLESNYLSDINSEDLAAMCGLNVCSFREIFKEHKGTSPMKYKNHLRMQYAHELLESGLYTVSEVSNILNCSDLSHFNKMYRKGRV